MTENTNKTLADIIDFGRLNSNTKLETLFSNWQKYRSFIDQIHSEIKSENNDKFLHDYEIYHKLSDKYDFDSLLNLIKGITIIENSTNHGGSASPVIALYKKLVKKAGLPYLTTGDKRGIYILVYGLERNPNSKIINITNWILENSKNPYLPFGISTLISKTLPDIKLEVKNWIERQKEIAIREKNEKLEKEKRDKKRQKKIAEKNKITKIERNYRRTLKELSTYDLLKIILGDKTRPIYYYTNEINKIKKLEPKEIKVVNNLISKLEMNKSKQANKLKKRLLNLKE